MLEDVWALSGPGPGGQWVAHCLPGSRTLEGPKGQWSKVTLGNKKTNTAGIQRTTANLKTGGQAGPEQQELNCVTEGHCASRDRGGLCSDGGDCSDRVLRAGMGRSRQI